MLARIAARVHRLLRRRALDPSDVDLSHADPMVEESPLWPASVGWRVGDDPDAPWVVSTAPRHAHLAGFDLHANVAVPAADRTRLEQLCRYLLRSAVAQDRLRLLADGRVVLTLKTACLELLEKLVVLTPRPRINLVLGADGDGIREGVDAPDGQTHVHRYLRPLLAMIEGRPDPSFIVSHRWPLSRAAEAYRIWNDKAGDCTKIVLDPTR